MYLNYDILAVKIKLSQFLILSRFCPNTLILLWCGNDKGGMAVKGRASSREANIRDSAAVPILVTAIHRMPVASTAMGVDATGLWRRLAGSIRKTMSGWCRTYLLFDFIRIVERRWHGDTWGAGCLWSWSKTRIKLQNANGKVLVLKCCSP